MAPRTLYDKIWDAHVAHQADDGTCLAYILTGIWFMRSPALRPLKVCE